MVATEMVMAKGRYIRPVSPGRNSEGTKTASSTRVVATMAPPTSPIAFDVASFAERPSVSISRMVFSTTTMASSTTMPMASTSPNSVRLLIDWPVASITAKVPISETGMVTAGTRVVRQSWRKIQTVKITSRMATNSVSTTSSIDWLMYSVES